ncbi:MAG: TRAP transporter substrate-binding protein [Alphaproteobacteria bacterium]|nr:TRAP transporter substrate-binding protein [Alphaproteobacteria bacterium]
MQLIRSLALATGLAAAATAAWAQQTIVFGGSDAIGGTFDVQNKLFTKLVNERAAGKLRVNFIAGEQLGPDMQVIEQMMQSSVQMYGDVLDWYANFNKDFAVFGWGFTFRDADHVQKFIDSDIYKTMAEQLREKQGIRILAASTTQPRVLFSRKAVQSLADLKDVKMRVPEIKTYLALWETLGTRPSRLAWAEVPLGLRTGVVEAAEGPIASAYAAKMHEAAKFVTRTDHILSTAHITINEKYFTALSPDLQKIVADAAREAVLATRESASKEVDDIVAKMRKEGATVSSIDTKAINERAREAVAKMEAEGLWSAGLWQKIQGM